VSPKQAESKPKKQKVVKRPPKPTPLPIVDDDTEGTRKSKRQRMQPLDYWRNERVKVVLRRQGDLILPEISEVIRLPLLSPKVRMAGGKRKRTTKQEDDSLKEAGFSRVERPTALVLNPEGEEVEMEIVYTHDMVQPRPTMNNSFAFQRTFKVVDDYTTGIVVLDVDQEKPNRNTGDHTSALSLSTQVMDVGLLCRVGRRSSDGAQIHLCYPHWQPFPRPKRQPVPHSQHWHQRGASLLFADMNFLHV
jgi:centromere protein C